MAKKKKYKTPKMIKRTILAGAFFVASGLGLGGYGLYATSEGETWRQCTNTPEACSIEQKAVSYDYERSLSGRLSFIFGAAGLGLLLPSVASRRAYHRLKLKLDTLENQDSDSDLSASTTKVRSQLDL